MIEEIKQLIKDYNIKQYEMAEMLDIDSTQLCRWLTGERKPSKNTLLLLGIKLQPVKRKYKDIEKKS